MSKFWAVVAVSLCTAVFLLYPICATGQTDTLNEAAQLFGSQVGDTALFGRDVEIDGGVIVVGADSDGANEAGSVTVFRYSDLTGTWEEEQEILPADLGTGHQFGFSVMSSGAWIIAGSPHWEDPTIALSNFGAAYSFHFDLETGNWVETQRLEASTQSSGDNFGREVLIEGDRVFSSAPFDDFMGLGNSGLVFWFHWDEDLELWVEEQLLSASDPQEGDRFGLSMALSADIVAINAGIQPGGSDIGSGSGRVYMFLYDEGIQEFIETQVLTSDDPAEADDFGWRVALDGDVIAVSADHDDEAASDAGAVYVFRRDAISGDWIEEQKLTASDASEDALFGNSIALQGNVLVVGAINENEIDDDGSVYVFEYDEPSGSWNETLQLVASDGLPGDGFGYSVAIEGDLVAVGSIFALNEIGESTGAVYLFDLDAAQFLRGDVDGDGSVISLLDALYLLAWQFASGAGIPCADAADADGNGELSALLDALFILSWQFGAGPAPPAPGTESCGGDPSPDPLGCLISPPCL